MSAYGTVTDWLRLKHRRILSLSHTTLSPLLNLLISNLTSLLAALVHHLSSPSLVHPHIPLSKSQITLSVMHHPVFGVIFLPHSVNLVHHLSPTSHHPSLPLSSIPDLKLTCFKNPSHHRSSFYPPDCPSDFNRTAFTDFVPLCVMF